MKKFKTLLILILFILLMLTLTILVLWRASDTDKRYERPQRMPPASQLEFPEDEIVGSLSSGYTAPQTQPLQFPRADMTPAEKRAYTVQQRRLQQNAGTGQAPQGLTYRPLAGSASPYSSSVASYAGGKPYSPSATNTSVRKSQSTTRNQPGSNAVMNNDNIPAARRHYEEAREREAVAGRERIFSPYTPKTNKKQQEALQRRLDGISSGVEKAIAQALLPKSKKDANIEKYLARRNKGSETAQKVASGPFGGVVEQIEAQKDDVVNNMKEAYGNAAGGKAASLMNNFKNEMQSAVSNPKTTPQQKAAQTRKINAKYNNQLQDLSRQEGLAKVQTDQQAENEKYLAKIKEKYNAQTVDAARTKFDEFTKKKMELVNAQLPEDKLYEQLLPLQRKLDEDLKEVVVQNNPQMPDPLAPLNVINREISDNQLKEQEQAIKEGRVAPRAYKPDENTVKQFEKDLDNESQKRVDSVTQSYGPEAAAKIKELFSKYKTNQLEILQSGEDVNTINKTRQAETDKVNKSMQAVLQAYEKDRVENIKKSVQEGNSKYLNEIMNSPQMQKQPAGVKEQFRKEATPILDEMADKIAQLSKQKLSQEEMAAKQKEIQEEANKKLSAIGQNPAASVAAGEQADPAAREKAVKQAVADTKAQNEKMLAAMASDPQTQKLSQTQKTSLDKQARAILDKRAQKIEQALRTAKSQQELDKQLEQIGKETDAELNQIQIPAERPAPTQP